MESGCLMGVDVDVPLDHFLIFGAFKCCAVSLSGHHVLLFCLVVCFNIGLWVVTAVAGEAVCLCCLCCRMSFLSFYCLTRLHRPFLIHEFRVATRFTLYASTCIKYSVSLHPCSLILIIRIKFAFHIQSFTPVLSSPTRQQGGLSGWGPGWWWGCWGVCAMLGVLLVRLLLSTLLLYLTLPPIAVSDEQRKLLAINQTGRSDQFL